MLIKNIINPKTSILKFQQVGLLYKKELRRFIWVMKQEVFELFEKKATLFFGYKKIIKKIIKEYAKILS